MSSLTQNLQTACRNLVQDQLPHEAVLFDHVWTAFWETLGCQRIEELEVGSHVGGEGSPVRVLGAVGSGRQELDTLFVLGAFVNTMVSILRDRPEGDITIDAIGDTLKREFVRIDAPDHLRPVLFQHGVGLLADLLDVERPATEAPSVIPDGQLWVEYCPRAEKRHDSPPVERGHFDPVAVDREFRSRSKDYDVFIDEPQIKILLSAKAKKEYWRKLEPRHRKLLGLILKAFPMCRPIAYAEIHKHALDYPVFDPDEDRPKV